MASPKLTTLFDCYGKRPEWMKQAACDGVPVAVFYPPDEKGEQRAKKVCATCDVQAECLAYALNHHRDATDAGVWGGTTDRERRAIRRRTRRELARRRKDVTSVT